MVRTLFAITLGMVMMLVVPAMADWSPQDGHKMHFPQLPDEQGWDVNGVNPVVLADDWRCSESGPVTKVHFWGSWRDVTGDGVGDVGTIVGFIIRFWSDVPDPDGPGPLYSHPGTVLWTGEVNNFIVAPIDPPTLEAWFDPSKDPDVVVPNDHDAYFQYNLDLTQLPVPVFVQEAGQIYWLSVSAILQPDALPYEWGWKSTIDHFNDDAVWAMEGLFNWTEMYEPPRVNNFSVIFNPDGSFGGGGGSNAYGSGWYFYEGSGWYNIWFYDNPFTYEHTKVGFIQGMVLPINPLQPSNVTIAVNWSTDAWSLQVPPPDGPPLPGVDEALYIGRTVIYSGPVPITGIEIYEPFNLVYNPEWVSIDVMGTNFNFNGRVSHECYRTSLDLAFVIDGGAEPTGACCFPDGTCLVMTQAACLASGVNQYAGDGTMCMGDNNGNGVDDACDQFVSSGACCYVDGSCANLTQAACIASGGLYAGNGTACAGDLDGNGVDDACEQVTPKGACCMPDGTCLVTTPMDCAAFGGTHMGIGSPCMGDSNGNGVDDACEMIVPSGACCFDNGTCLVRTSIACVAAGGLYAGDGTACAGDGDQNGVDDACEGTVQMGACCYGNPLSPTCINTTATVCGQSFAGTWYSGQDCATFTCPVQPEPPKWEQAPDLTPTGMDVNATAPMLLADDFLCTTTGPITKIEVYGSWYHDMLPGDPAAVAFTLSLHLDIPATPGGYSMPGPLLCVANFLPGTYQVEPVNMIEMPEGWFDPPSGLYEMPADFTCWKYTFKINDPCWVQNGTEQQPMVYWLDVQAQPPVMEARFGWKTSLHHWNDDGVWAQGAEPWQGPWLELRYPPLHPMAQQSIDLAFAVYTVADTCAMQNPGDFDNDGDIDNNDLTALTAFYQGLGSPPPVHANGDFNGDCRINELDAIDLASYLNTGQPLPVACTCQEPYPFRSCCIGQVGNSNCSIDEMPTIGDISVMIDAAFIAGACIEYGPGANVRCIAEADMNLSGGSNPICEDITIGDISLLIDCLFITGEPPFVRNNCY